MKQNKELVRRPWAKSDLLLAYHDQEWGVPVHEDRLLFEFLILEGAELEGCVVVDQDNRICSVEEALMD